MKRHISWTNVFLALVTSLFAMFLIWEGVDPRFIPIFVVLLAFAEVFVQLRWRLSMPCPHCGFDPVLYLKDHKAASEKVSQFLEARRQRPESLLSTKNPFALLPKRNSREPLSKREVDSSQRLQIPVTNPKSGVTERDLIE
jgi:hypothetical protein